MHFQGLDAHGDAALRVSNASGLCFTAASKDVTICPNFEPDTRVLSGVPGNVTFDASRTSLFDDELKASLTDYPHLAFWLQTAGDLAAAARDFAPPAPGGWTRRRT